MNAIRAFRASRLAPTLDASAGIKAGATASSPFVCDEIRPMVESHSPVLEMLWEVQDPDAVLDGRFGFSDGESAGRWLSAMLSANWGVRVHSCERIVMSDHNALGWVLTPSGRMLAKWSVASARFPRLLEMARLTNWLDDQGLPVSAPVPAKDGRLQVEFGGVSMGLQYEIQGDLLDVSDPRQVWATGAMLARLHDALASYPDGERVAALAEQPHQLAVRLADWLEFRAEHLPARARDTLQRLVAEAAGDPLSVQLVHGDVRSANVLCAEGEVVAVIDFEEARFDHRVVELARSAVMLGTRFRHWGPVSADVRMNFSSGYQSERVLTPVEASWWDALVLWCTLVLIPAGNDPTGWKRSAMSQLAELTP